MSFEEARTAFLDEHARVIRDSEHSDDEDRFVLLGLSVQLRVLVVCHCYRESDQVVRIISALPAAPIAIEHSCVTSPGKSTLPAGNPLSLTKYATMLAYLAGLSLGVAQLHAV